MTPEEYVDRCQRLRKWVDRFGFSRVQKHVMWLTRIQQRAEARKKEV